MKRKHLIQGGIIAVVATSVLSMLLIVCLGNRLVVRRGITRADAVAEFFFADTFLPDTATDVSIASRLARFWFYARFQIGEEDFVAWFAAQGVTLEEITSPIHSRDTFDFYYQQPERQETVIAHGLRFEGRAGRFEHAQVYFDRDSGTGYVSCR